MSRNSGALKANAGRTSALHRTSPGKEQGGLRAVHVETWDCLASELNTGPDCQHRNSTDLTQLVQEVLSQSAYDLK